MTDKAAVVWSDPPRLPGLHDHVLDACKQDPGRWAEWPGSVSAGTELRKQGWDFVIRTIDTPEGRRQKGWVRYPADAFKAEAS